MTINMKRARDVRRWHGRIGQVIADGADVTRLCWRVDVRRRRVWLYVRDAFTGRIVINLDTRRPATIERRVKRLVVRQVPNIFGGHAC